MIIETEVVKLEAECFIHPVVLPEGRIVVLQDGFKYSGRIAIPEVAKRRPTTGHVVRVSDTDTLGHLLGQRIIFGMYAGTLVTFKDKPAYRILECREVQGIVDLEDTELEALE